MYYIYGVSGPSLLIESTDSMIILRYYGNFCANDNDTTDYFTLMHACGIKMLQRLTNDVKW